MLLVLASVVSLHWSANMLLINWQVSSSIPSEGMLVCCHCVVKCWYANLKYTISVTILVAYAASPFPIEGM